MRYHPLLQVLGTTTAVAALACLTACSSGSDGSSGGKPAASSGPSAATSTGTASGAASGASAPGSRQVTAAVRAFYEHYAATPTREGSGQYLTDAAASAVFAPGGSSDRVYCAQNAPASVTFAPPVMSDDRATVVVTTHWQGSPDRHVTLTVTLPEILISRITCPA